MITQSAYAKGVEFCQRNLFGRLVLSKGDKPYTTKDLTTKLMKQWKIFGQWKMLSLGKGYYEFSFASLADLHAIWALGTINLKPGVLRLFMDTTVRISIGILDGKNLV
jgi:hypothetical protein